MKCSAAAAVLLRSMYVRVRLEQSHSSGQCAFEDAASVNIAGITALQALRDKGKVQPGQKVLINGASGGVGTFAVQIAKSLVGCDGRLQHTKCRSCEIARADHVIDYTKEDFTKARNVTT